MKSPKQILHEKNLLAKKSLGQNFLKDPAWVHRILKASDLDPNLGVFEIGPGLGAMTESLLNEGFRVCAVEIDRRLIQYLEQRFGHFDHFILNEGDVLHMPLENIQGLEDRMQVVANLPYNQATEIIFRLMEHSDRFQSIHVMVQKEVALRLVAQPGTKAFGKLSILPQIYFEIQSVLDIPGNQFEPTTKVDSSILKMRKRKEPLVDLSDPAFALFFKKMLGPLFQWRRKTLGNILKRWIWADANAVQTLQDLGIEPKRRPETLHWDELEKLAKHYMPDSEQA